MAIPFKTEERTVGTQGQLRSKRHTGKIPGVVYGKNLGKPVTVFVDEKELMGVLRSHPHSLLEIELPGTGKQPVMMTDVQRDPLSRNVLHVDFHHVNMNEEVKAPVRIEIVGDSQGVREGGILQVNLHEIEVHCLPDRIPESLQLDVSALLVGENLHVSDLKLPEGVTTRADAEQVIVTVLAPQKELEAEEAAEEAAEAKEADERAAEADTNSGEMEKE